MYNLDSNGNIIIDPNLLQIPAFKEIWEKDNTKDKKNAYSTFSGFYFLANPNSPYWEWENKKKEKEIEKQYFEPSNYKIKDKDIQEGLRQYIEFLNINPSQFLLEAAKETLYKLAQHLKTVPITSGKDGNILQISSAMDRIAKTFASYDSMKQAIEKEKIGAVSKKGDHEIGYDED